MLRAAVGTQIRGKQVVSGSGGSQLPTLPHDLSLPCSCITSSLSSIGFLELGMVVGCGSLHLVLLVAG